MMPIASIMESASIIAAGITLIAVGFACALMLRIAENKTRQLQSETNADFITLIDDLLPQTQCGECGHPGCRPYAEAMAQGEAINRCPPGGDKTIAALANLLDKPIVPLDGNHKPERVAFIREAECIGCTKCIQACPVDAIVGAKKLMHTVIADECTGCDLCVEPCPVDCIEMRLVERTPQPAEYRNRFIAHNKRVEIEARERDLKRSERKKIKEEKKLAEKIDTPETAVSTGKTKQDEIREAIARAKAKKSSAQSNLSQPLPPSSTDENDNNA